MTLSMQPTAAQPGDEYISFHMAQKIAGITEHDLYASVFAGQVRLLVKPGRCPKCSLSDVQKLASRG